APAHRTVSQSIALTVVVFCMLAFLAVYLSRRLVRPADTALAERVAELAETRDELQQALVRFTEVQEDERRTIAQAVHDDTIQALIATMWALDDLDAGETSPHVAEVLGRARTNLARAGGAARSLLFELRPPALDELGTGGPARAGIVGMRETIAMYGGSFAIGPRPAGGTRVTFSLPLPAP